jgi:hypothetical protein
MNVTFVTGQITGSISAHICRSKEFIQQRSKRESEGAAAVTLTKSKGQKTIRDRIDAIFMTEANKKW